MKRSVSLLSSSVMFCASFMFVIAGASLWAQNDNAPDGVTLKDGQVCSLRGDQSEALTEDLKLPFDVEVKTNGTFTVADGKERKLEEGQVIRRDGWLMNRDGSVEPVFDHVAMKDGRVVIVQDGKVDPLTGSKTFPNNLRIGPDGWCVYPSGVNNRLMDGQLFRLDGSPILTKDTITLKGGRVLVQRFGKVVSVSGLQIAGMSDGSRVNGSGLLTKMDGTTIQLREGQTVLVDGLLSRR